MGWELTFWGGEWFLFATGMVGPRPFSDRNHQRRADADGFSKIAEMTDGRPNGRPVTEPNGGQDGELWVRIVEGQVRALKFGSVQITVHEGRVVQVETNSKIRIDRP